MKKIIAIWQFIGFGVTSIGGVLLHFLYDWTGESIFAAPFSGVNESTWEHMKLLYFPLFSFALVQVFFFRELKNFWFVKLFGILAGLIAIPIIFYTYNGVFGKSPDWINITIFFVASAIAFMLEYLLFKNEKLLFNNQCIAFCIILIIGVLFAVFTFIMPHIPLFEDPITGGYGL